MTAAEIVPPMTHPHGRYWTQPDGQLIEIDATHALMSRATFSRLADYSNSVPTGAYPGKMWRRGPARGHRDPVDGEWMLCWYEIHEHNREMVRIRTRRIIFLD